MVVVLNWERFKEIVMTCLEGFRKTTKTYQLLGFLALLEASKHKV
jgi:hypothetical protein